MTARFTPRARADLEAILSYLDQHNPQGARNVVRTIRKTIDLIGFFPVAGRVVGEENMRALPVGRYPYLIYWRVDNRTAWIVHIRHAARRPWEPGSTD